jgi:hypothetical protein
MSEEKRKGPGYHWTADWGRGYVVDNLDTKQLSDLDKKSDPFERIFILTREALMSYEKLDRGLDGDILDVCQHISRYLSQNRKSIK